MLFTCADEKHEAEENKADTGEKACLSQTTEVRVIIHLKVTLESTLLCMLTILYYCTSELRKIWLQHFT